MNAARAIRLGRLAALWGLGAVALFVLAWTCSSLGLGFATASFLALVVIILLSLLDSLISSFVFSVVAVACLNYFFVPPLRTFHIASGQDVSGLATFLVASLAITTLVRRIRQLADTRRAQSQLLDLTQDAIFVRGDGDVITYWNHGAQALYGWTRHEAVGKIAHDLLRTDFPAPLADITHDLLASGRWEGELVHTSRTGERIIVSSRWSLQRDEAGRPVATLETNTDVTDRRHAEERLRDIEGGYLTEAQKLSLTGSFGWNVESREVFWSEESYRIFGYDGTARPTLDTMLARVHPADIQVVREAIDTAARTRAPLDFEHRLVMPDGAIKHLHVLAHPLETTPQQFVGALMDVTAHRTIQEELRYSEYRYHNLFRALAASFWEVDFSEAYQIARVLRKSGVMDLARHLAENPAVVRDMMRASRVVDVNEQTVALFGRGDKAELLVAVEPFWPDESTAVYASSMIAAITGQPSFATECRLRTIDGRTFEALFTACFPPESVADGRLLIGVIDISARVRAQEKLQQVQSEFAHAARVSMLGELTASIAHEVNQPLAAINTNASAALRWLDRGEPDVAEVRTLAARIIADSARAS